VQWTDESGGAYGEDPYGGVGYPYTYGYDYSSATSDTATMPWNPAQLAVWTHPSGDTHATGADPYATGTHFYATGPDPATHAWDIPHVLTVPPPELDTTGHPEPGPDTPESDSVRPIFVDASGRRQRRVLRAARLLVIPAGGYVALLISTVLGGPSLSSPFVPQPDSTHPKPHAAAPDSSPDAGHSAGSASPTAAQQTSRPTDRPTASATSAAASVPTAAPTTVTAPTRATPTSNGRAIGSSHKPLK